jgi:ATP-binding cassette subfamily F protein 3
MLLHPSNFLLLDEPTNHLDLRAKDVLLEALQNFSGTVVFVSHDRYFIDKLATRVFEIGGGKVEVFPGNYEDYVWRKTQPQRPAGEAVEESSTAVASGNGAGKPAEISPQEQSSAEPKQKRLNPIKLRQMKERCHDLEEEIARLEAAIADAETALQTYVSAEETKRQSDALNQYRADLGACMTEWEELAQVLESAQ